MEIAVRRQKYCMNFALHETATKDGDRDLKSDGAFGLRTVDGKSFYIL